MTSRVAEDLFYPFLLRDPERLLQCQKLAVIIRHLIARDKMLSRAGQFVARSALWSRFFPFSSVTLIYTFTPARPRIKIDPALQLRRPRRRFCFVDRAARKPPRCFLFRFKRLVSRAHLPRDDHFHSRQSSVIPCPFSPGTNRRKISVSSRPYQRSSNFLNTSTTSIASAPVRTPSRRCPCACCRRAFAHQFAQFKTVFTAATICSDDKAPMPFPFLRMRMLYMLLDKSNTAHTAKTRLKGPLWRQRT